ncbi:MAG: hypothetical protein AAGB07_06230, partial [Pseudomonadota bacterium]
MPKTGGVSTWTTKISAANQSGGKRTRGFQQEFQFSHEACISEHWVRSTQFHVATVPGTCGPLEICKRKRDLAEIVSAGRLRKSPYYQSTINEGAETLLTYNNMLVPRGYGDREAEYWRLINGVSMWDVAVQRQVQLKGPDAAKLAQTLCVRDLSNQKIGQGKYVAICDHQGTLINDPIAMKIAD